MLIHIANIDEIFIMHTTVEAKKAEIPKTFATKKANTMGVQHFQLNIPISFRQVVDIVRQLSPSEKQQLGEVLWDEQNIDDIIIPEEHRFMVRERIKKYENNPEKYLSWDNIERKISAQK